MMQLTYDYIIVGGGTAGCVLAHRLASETTASILLLEAGRDAGTAQDVLIPGKYIYQLDNDPEGLWTLPTAPQKHLNGRQITFLRGRQLGGSSAVNYMGMARGPADDYDEWARRTGDQSWTWENILPKMKAMEDFDASVPEGFEDLARPRAVDHGIGGPIKVGFGKTMTPGVEKFVKACQENGIGLCADINSGNPVGVSLAQFNVRDGIRHYAANAYLDETFRSKHANLHIQTNTSVRKLLFRGQRAIGVELYDEVQDRDTRVHCSQEVVLCAGTFATPQILLSSGIGPQASIDALDIPLVHHVPGVGQGMLDHTILTLEFRVRDPSIDFSRLFNEKALLNSATEQYNKDHTGPLSVFGTSGSVAFPKIEALAQCNEFQDLDGETQSFLLHPSRPSGEIWLGSGYASYAGPVSSNDSFMNFELLLQNNQSQGTVSMKKTASGTALEIDPNFLSHAYDKRIAIETVRTALQISKAEVYKDEIEEMVHGPRAVDDDAILDFVKQNLGQGYHSIGTCKMGLDSDPMRVVDSKFNVDGVAGLKLADLSVCPVLTCNHTQINAYLIGDQCADVIIREWQEHRSRPQALL